MVSGRGLSPGLLGRRGAAEPLLPRDHPAQAAEAAEELPGACRRARPRRLSAGRGAAQAVVDRGAEAFVGHRRDRDPRLGRRVGLVEQVEQARRGFDQVARRAEAGVARRSRRSRSDIRRPRRRRRSAAAAWTARNGWRAGPALRSSSPDVGSASIVDRARPQQAERAAGRRDDGRFEAALGRAGVDDQRDAAAEALQHMLGAGRADRAAGIGRRRGERPAGRARAAPASPDAPARAGRWSAARR